MTSPTPSSAPTIVASAPEAAGVPPAPGAGELGGRWSGRRIVLELSPAGPRRYQGTLTLRTRELRVTVNKTEQGWIGTLAQEEVEAKFALAREGVALVMVSDGRTYRLEAAPPTAKAWLGDYKGPRETSLTLSQAPTGYTGTLVLESVRYVVSGRLREGELVGSLRDPLTGKELTWRASDVDEGGLLFTIRLEEQDAEGRASYHALRFERAKDD